MRDREPSEALLFPILYPYQPGKNQGTRGKKLRLTKSQSRARSMAGEREREKERHDAAMEFIKADPRRLAEWKRRNPCSIGN